MVSYEKYSLKSGETRWRVHYRDPNHVTKEKSGFRRKMTLRTGRRATSP